MRSVSRGGFTLIDAVVMMGMVGMMFSALMPRYSATAMKAQRAEIPVNVAGIAAAQTAHQQASASFVTTWDWHPRTALDGDSVPWSAGSEFDVLGWAPPGEVWGRYRTWGDEGGFRVFGQCDVDQNQVQARYHHTHRPGRRPATEEGWMSRADIF